MADESGRDTVIAVAGVAAVAALGALLWKSSQRAENAAPAKLSKPLVIKGDHVSFELDNGRIVRLPSSYGIVHDTRGTSLPRCNIYFGPFRKTDIPVYTPPSDARAYFGKRYVPRKAEVDVPTGAWNSLGNVVQIFYRRTPGSEHGGKYFHPFYKRAYFNKQPLVLSRLKSFYRIELPSGCIVNYRGFVFP